MIGEWVFLLGPATTILFDFCCKAQPALSDSEVLNHSSSYQHIKGINPISLKLRATSDPIGVARLKPKPVPVSWFETVARIKNSMQEQDNIKEREVKLDWKRWLNYQSLVRQVPFFLFLAVLAVIYIYNGHYADKTIRNINRTAKEVKELQWEYKTVKSEVMFLSKQSELVKAVEPLELKELTEAPVILAPSNSPKGGE